MTRAPSLPLLRLLLHPPPPLQVLRRARVLCDLPHCADLCRCAHWLCCLVQEALLLRSWELVLLHLLIPKSDSQEKSVRKEAYHMSSVTCVKGLCCAPVAAFSFAAAAAPPPGSSGFSSVVLEDCNRGDHCVDDWLGMDAALTRESAPERPWCIMRFESDHANMILHICIYTHTHTHIYIHTYTYTYMYKGI